MGAFLDLMAISEYDTEPTRLTEREQLIAAATRAIDERLARKAAKEALDDKLAWIDRRAFKTNDRRWKNALEELRDKLIEAYEENTPEALEDRAREWYMSGQPMGPEDH